MAKVPETNSDGSLRNVAVGAIASQPARVFYSSGSVPATGSGAVALGNQYRNDPAHQINPYGITSTTSFADAHQIALSDPVTALITPLVTSQGVAVHS